MDKILLAIFLISHCYTFIPKRFIDYQRKHGKARIIQKKNEELKKIKYQIECYLSQPS